MAERYENATVLVTPQSKPYIKGKQYPNIPFTSDDIYVIATVGDRLDYLAYSYYNDSTLWWIISMANNNVTKGSMFPTPGTQIRIPSDISAILRLYNNFNTAR